MTSDALDYRFMGRALSLAQRGLYSTDPNPRVGCVIVKNGEIVAEGWHEQAGSDHAEIMAIKSAKQSLEGACCYVTLEPCAHHGKTPPCADALVAAKVSRVVVAMEDPNPLVAGSGIKILNNAGIEVNIGLMASKAQQLNLGFIKRMTEGLPYVTCKMGMSMDARTAMASGESQWITCPESRQQVQLMRARCSAIITGSGTVIADNPSMNVRKEQFPETAVDSKVSQPWRVIVDSQRSVPADSKIFDLEGHVVWVNSVSSKQQDTDKLSNLVMAGENNMVALKPLLQWLAQQGCNEVLIEAGAKLTGAFIAADLVDELVLFMAPKLLGDEARGLVHLPGLDKLADAKRYQVSDASLCGDDVRLTYKRLS